MEKILKGITDNIIQLLPNKWEKVVLYSQVTEESYEFFFHVKVNGEYTQCFNLPIPKTKILNAFDTLYNILLPDQKQKHWSVATFVIDNKGNANFEYDYSSIENSISYKNTWKARFLQ